MSPAKGFDEGWADFARHISPVVLRAYATRAPRKTGAYARSFRVYTNQRQVILTARRFPGEWIMHGTRPHVIEPVVAAALHFTARDGSEVFARRVNHPGTRPNHFAEDAWTAIRSEVVDAFGRLVSGKMKVDTKLGATTIVKISLG